MQDESIEVKKNRFACPPMCKDDAVSTLLYLTPGKQNLFVEGMAEGRAKQGPSGSFACIAVRCNATEKKGKAGIVHLINTLSALTVWFHSLHRNPAVHGSLCCNTVSQRLD